MNNFIWLFIIVILLLITVIVFTKKSKEKLNFTASYNYNHPVQYFRKGRKNKHKNKNQANQLNDTYPECTPDDLSTKGCSQCPQPSSGQDTYCCMNGNPPACSSPGGGPIAGCTPQCVIKYKPPAPVEECTQEQIYQDQCNKWIIAGTSTTHGTAVSSLTVSTFAITTCSWPETSAYPVAGKLFGGRSTSS